jgi:drug/metabolite transporter (DMT)-like permease
MHSEVAAPRPAWTQRKADWMLALVSMAWGSSYLLMKIGLGGIRPFFLIALRFGIAFVVTALLFCRKMFRTDLRTAAYGALLGLLLFGVFSFLMFGLGTTTASTAGFLTSTTVVFVPLLQALVTKKLPAPRVALGTGMTLLGIGLLTIRESLAMSGGAVECLLGALLTPVISCLPTG